jgi:signal peptidase II
MGMAADPRGAVGVRPASTRWLSFVAVGAYVIILDQLTKDIVRTALEPGEGVHIFGSFWIQPFTNPGIAGGAFAGDAAAAAIGATVAVVGILAFLVRHGAAGRSITVGFGLLIGGGIGNLLDRLRAGYVTDFIVNGNQAFNLADVAILAGTAVILTGLCVRLLRSQLKLFAT